MKKLALLLTAIAFSSLGGIFSAAVAQESAPNAAAAAGNAARRLPLYARIEAIDLATKTFTTKKKDGTIVKYFVTPTTEISNVGTPARFEDLQVGQTVSGLRAKKSASEYEVVKITKFVVAVPATPEPATE